MKQSLLCLAGLLIASTSLQAADETLFPFVLPWDDASPGVANVSSLLEKPAGKHGFVVARNGHLYAGDRRIRFFGVNTAFGANFPTHADADKIAPRMARFGINCVRFHHMDMQAAPNGVWKADMRTFDPSQLDKLDYFIARLKENGIYADLNLHVSRNYPGMPTWEGAPSYFKGVDLFHPPMIAMQHDYARCLLTHVNPYTKRAYVDEPAVAIIEINNEDGLICSWWGDSLDNMPAVYRTGLESGWNQWLVNQYTSQANLRKAWSVVDQPLGADMIRDGDFTRQPGTAWQLEQHESAKAVSSHAEEAAGGGLRINVQQPGKAGWHVQLVQNGIALTQGSPYTLAFRARADSPRRINVVASQAHAPWEPLWSVNAELTPEWHDFRFTFQPGETDARARIVFSNLGGTSGTFGFAGVSLRPGGLLGIQKGEQFGAMPMFIKSGFGMRTTAAQRDWMRFLWQIEERYWAGMEQFLKHDLKAHSLIVGTATGFSPPTLQAGLDVVDAHAYWQHPHFPHRPWDSEDWTVNNIPMAGAQDGGIIPGLAFRRVTGKPFICTEFNAAAPNTHSSEAFLLLSAYAALQDWDGIFAFAYSHRHDDWNAQHIPNFFDIDQHPTKLATLPAAVAMFMRGDVGMAASAVTVPVSQEMAIEKCRQAGSWWAMDSFGTGKLSALQSITQMAIQEATSGHPPITPTPVASGSTRTVTSDNREITWDGIGGVVTVNAARSKMFVGRTTGGAVSLDGVRIAPERNRQDWAAITMTAMDGPDFKSPGRILITASGYAENTGTQWKDAAKSSVGRNWGKAPSVVEGISAVITLPVSASQVQAWALDERGQRGGEIKIEPSAEGALLKLGPEHKTLWYELDINPGR